MSAAPTVQRLRKAHRDAARVAVPLVPAVARRGEGPRADPPLAGPAPRGFAAVRSRAPARDAWEKLAAPLRQREGIRVGAIGITGSGKTTGLKNFLKFLTDAKLVDLVIVHDIKLPDPQYAGDLAAEADTLIDHPPERYPTTVILRRTSIDHAPSVETAAYVTKHASWHGVPTLLVVDEFKKALSPMGREFAAPTVAELLSEGRGLGASLAWSTQIPQRVPTEAYDQSKILLFRCGRKALSYLRDQSVVDDALAQIVAHLKTGQFVIASAEDDFDGIVYEVPFP